MKTVGRRRADGVRAGKEGVEAMKLLLLLDGYKRVIALLTYVLEGIAQAAGLGDHTPMIGTAFHILRWDGLGVEIGPALQAGFTLWAIVDGIIKTRRARAAAGQGGVASAVVAVLVFGLACAPAVTAQPAVEGLRVEALAGGLVSLQGTAAAAVEPLVHVAVDAPTATSLRAPRLLVVAGLTALPGESLELGDPGTFRALELKVGLDQPLARSLRFRLHVAAGFATRLPGNPEPRTRAARFAQLGLRFSGPRGSLMVAVGPDQRLGDRQAEGEVEGEGVQTSAPTAAPVPPAYQVTVTVEGHVDLGDLGRGRVTLIGSAVLGLDLSRRWATLNGGATDVVRLGIAVGL